MGLFDKIKNQSDGSVEQATNSIDKGSGKSVSVVFASMPETLAEFTALPYAAMQTPFDTAAMAVAALCVYPLSKDECAAMINYLRGPNPMAPREVIFLSDRMAQNKKAPYLGASKF